MTRRSLQFLVLLVGLTLLPHLLHAQENTGDLQGIVRDPSGAVVPNVDLRLASPTLTGEKTLTTDTAGYFRFRNLQPGVYALDVNANGFRPVHQSGVLVQVGRLPTLNIALRVGDVSQTVDVGTNPALIDPTSVVVQTNITQDVIQYVPHGRSFQSVIQFAPAARNEPLAGFTPQEQGNGNGGNQPGFNTNGQTTGGYQIAGGSDAENGYLIDGLDSSTVIGGYSYTNVPFDFIQEVQIKTAGAPAQYGEALGGVVDVTTKSGSSQIHGSVFLQFSNSALNGGPNGFMRYDPSGSPQASGNGLGTLDTPTQFYQPKRDKTSDVFPGFTIGGPLLRNRIFYFVGFNPEWTDVERTVNFGGTPMTFSQNLQTFYTDVRIDGRITDKLRVFGSYYTARQHESGRSLPEADSTTGLQNVSSELDPAIFDHAHGFTAPNLSTTYGVDWSLTQRLISTTRFGYFFQNYHDFGYPTSGVLFDFFASGVGNPTLPTDLQQPTGFFNIANLPNYTRRNADKRYQFDETVAYSHSDWEGTHNFAFGYQLLRSSNDIDQHYNVPDVQVSPTPAPPRETYGFINIFDNGSVGRARQMDHAIFLQDAWTIAHGVTVNYGVRIEHEYLGNDNPNFSGLAARPINFGWGAKVAPRIGAAWDVFHNGSTKIFGSYGVFNDIMKLNVAIGAFGGHYQQNCFYGVNPGFTTLPSIDVVFDGNDRYCSGTGGANFAGGVVPAGLTFETNVNQGATEGVLPGLKPYRQHNTIAGVDRTLTSNVLFEARYDRRRLDDAIEDGMVTYNPGETFAVKNPGKGADTYNTVCPACPRNIPAARSYDGVELRLTKAYGSHWMGVFSYTYSHLRGNYSGLTSTDLADGGGGRNAPNDSGAFDEPYYSFNSHGTSSSGLLTTDRPNAFKGYAYYRVPWAKWTSTDLGIFQVAYSGTPLGSYLDVGDSAAAGGLNGNFPVYVENRGQWVDVSQDPFTGIVTAGAAHTRRTPWFTQTDFNLKQSFRLTGRYSFDFDATVINLLNQRAVTGYYSQIDSNSTPSFIAPGGLYAPVFGIAPPAITYATYESPYDWRTLLNDDGVIVSKLYGKPYTYQVSRGMRLQFHFNF